MNTKRVRGRLHEARRHWPPWARALTVKPLVIVVTILVVLVGSFLAYGAYTRGPTRFSHGGAWFGSGTPRSGVTPSTGPANLWAMLPKEGVYAFSGGGHEEADIGFVPLCGWDIGPSVPLDVHGTKAVAGGHQVVFDWVLNADHDKVRYVWQMSPKGVGVAFIGAEVTCQGIERADDSEYLPVVRRFQFPLVVGASWNGASSSMTRTETFRTRVVFAGQLELAGRKLSTWVIKDHIDITGDQQGTRDETWWHAPALGMAVKMHFHTSVKQGGANFTSDCTLTLQRLPG